MIEGYILEGKTPKPVYDIIEWAEWLGSGVGRHVVDTRLPDGARVSTVFLGLDHGHGFSGRPLLFETMIFGGEHDGFMDRYSTWEEAERGHEAALKMVQGEG